MHQWIERGQRWVVGTGAVCALVLGNGCATANPASPGASSAKSKPVQELKFDPVTITGDPALEKLNDEELFAEGSSAFAAGEYAKAARYFDRIIDFHPDSKNRRQALFNAGLSHEKLEHWDDAYQRFSALMDAEHGHADALDATFKAAETLYHLGRFPDAAQLLTVLANRADLTAHEHLEAEVQQGICELEAGNADAAETTLRKAGALYEQIGDEKDDQDTRFAAQGQFFLGEIYRLRYESVTLDPDKSTDALSQDLENKAELLLSAQGHYLRAIRIGDGYWATASGTQIGGLYENLYQQMVSSPAPKELNTEEAEVYRQELRKKIRVLVTKAINIYERTLEAAERIGSQNPFVDKTRERLQKMKDLLVADAEADPSPPAPAAADGAKTAKPASKSPPPVAPAREPHS